MPGEAAQTGCAADEQHMASAFQQMGEREMSGVDAPQYVDREDLLKHLRLDLLKKGLFGGKSGIVDQHVEPAKSVDRVPDQRPALLGFGNVGGMGSDRQALFTEFGTRRFKALRISAVDYQTGALPAEFPR